MKGIFFSLFFILLCISYIGGSPSASGGKSVHADGKERATDVDPSAIIDTIKSSNLRIVDSPFSLPYENVIDPDSVVYQTIATDAIVGMDEYSAGETEVRYLSLPAKDNIKVILIPRDQGDFPYRYYLLTVNDMQVMSGIYVEGEWWEPESENIEKTTFYISRDYEIAVKTTYEANTSVVYCRISNNGEILRQQ